MKKFLSLILALTLVASLFTVNVMAASKAHTITITPDKATGLVAGDVIVLDVTIDNTLKLQSADYKIEVDSAGLEVDTGKTSKVFNFLDKDWFTEIKNEESYDYFAYYLGAPQVTGTASSIAIGWLGNPANGGVAEEDATDNRVIGKFKVKVKADAADGEYTIRLTDGVTCDEGENFGANMVCEPITVKVGADAPAVVEPTFGATTDMGTDGVVAGGKKYDNALAVETKIAAGTNTTEIGVLFAPEAWLDGAALVADKAGVAKAAKTDNLGAGETTITAAIKGIPRIFEGKNIVMVTVPYAFDGTNYTYGAEVKTIVNFGNTGE